MPEISTDELEKIRRIAGDLRRSWGYSVDFDELVSEGVIGYLMAKARVDPNRQDTSQSLTAIRSKGAMLDFLRKEHPWIARRGKFRVFVQHITMDALGRDIYESIPSYDPDPADRQHAELLLDVAARELSTLEARVLNELFFCERRSCEIAIDRRVTDSAIWKIRKSALAKVLRAHLLLEGKGDEPLGLVERGAFDKKARRVR